MLGDRTALDDTRLLDAHAVGVQHFLEDLLDRLAG
jgi:hypothetical protein